MAIELSNLTFTNNPDIVPSSGTEEITNAGIVNTLGGNDEITGTGETLQDVLFYGSRTVGIYNKSNSTINTDNGDDKITGSGNIGIYNEASAVINTGNGKDEITGYASQTGSSTNNTIGFLNDGTIALGGGDDIIRGSATGDFPGGVVNFGNIDAGDGADTITGDGSSSGVSNGAGGSIKTGNGNDSIIGTSDRDWGIYNGGFDESGFPTMSTGNGDDSIIGNSSGDAGIVSVLKGSINSDNGNDSLIGTGNLAGIACSEDGIINTGNGNDIITGTGNITGISVGSIAGSTSPTGTGTIDTGAGNDIITGKGGILNDTRGIIDTGTGNDIVNARDGGFRGFGKTLLGDGNDIVQGFGSGSFDGGKDNDTLELTSGNYTVGISETTVTFTSNAITMNTSEFEKLIAGSETYDFTGLSNGQIITIA